MKKKSFKVIEVSKELSRIEMNSIKGGKSFNDGCWLKCESGFCLNQTDPKKKNISVR